MRLLIYLLTFIQTALLAQVNNECYRSLFFQRPYSEGKGNLELFKVQMNQKYASVLQLTTVHFQEGSYGQENSRSIRDVPGDIVNA